MSGRACCVEGCVFPSRLHNMCRSHHRRWREHGDPLAGRIPQGTGLLWLQEKVRIETDDCIIWPFGVGSQGYPLMQIKKRHVSGHRLVCEWQHGPPPPDQPHALHSCDVRRCVNPRHLRWGNAADNARDSVVRRRRVQGERHHLSKLSEAAVAEIRRALASGTPVKEIAAQHGVDRHTISDIKSGRTWKGVDRE